MKSGPNIQKEIFSEIKAYFREVCILLDTTLKTAQESSGM